MYRMRLSNVCTSNGVPLVAMKHGIGIWSEKDLNPKGLATYVLPFQRKSVSNPIKIITVSMKVHPNLFPSKHCDGELHAMNIWSRVRRKRPLLTAYIKFHVCNGQKTPNVDSSWMEECSVFRRLVILLFFRMMQGVECTHCQMKNSSTHSMWRV